MSHSIHINPNFNKGKAPPITSAHINPNFLFSRSSTTAIHLNPKFLQKKLEELQQMQLQQNQQNLLATATTNDALDLNAHISGPEAITCKLIPKSCMRIVRSVGKKSNTLPNASTNADNPLVKLGNRKLLRRSLIRDANATAATKIVGPTKIASPHNAIAMGKYKIDRRCSTILSTGIWRPLKRKLRHAFVARYALRRTNDISPKKISGSSDGSNNDLRRGTFKLPAMTHSKSLKLLNINGVLYKSTHNKLQLKDQPESNCDMKPTTVTNNAKTINGGGRTIVVRGIRFILDQQGYKLTRATETALSTQHKNNNLPTSNKSRHNIFRRIDIGGLTYVATSQNTLVRTGNHLVRSHVNTAKQKSLQVLTRNLVKSNIPCAIFQRVGKCAAFERGRCRKVHDRLQVAICSRFLRGECANANCLLSHNVCLAKMPVCKFFLQGTCIRADCPYLHKNVEPNTPICQEFLRGYCRLAEMCKKRHEFLCPDYERNGKCVRVNCVYCKKKRQLHQEVIKSNINDQKNSETEETTITTRDENPDATEATLKRYFITDYEEREKSESTNSDDPNVSTMSNLKPAVGRGRRKKLGILPAYIPL